MVGDVWVLAFGCAWWSLGHVSGFLLFLAIMAVRPAPCTRCLCGVCWAVGELSFHSRARSSQERYFLIFLGLVLLVTYLKILSLLWGHDAHTPSGHVTAAYFACHT